MSLGRGHNAELDQPVVINFHHAYNISTKMSPACVSWNPDVDVWQESGCRLVATNITMSVCECGHLGNFALLLRNKTSNSPFMSEDVVATSNNQTTSHILIAEVITYIAVALSIILLVIIIFKVSVIIKSCARY